MKEYIFVAFHPGRLGGGEFYVNGKVKYLEEHGWIVHTFFSGSPNEKSIFPHMNPHMKDAIPGDMISRPPYRRMRWEQEYILDYMCARLTTIDGDTDEIIVESVEDVVSYWAELLAARIHARHIFVTCNEYFRDSLQTYEENLDFFYFKWKRKELFTSAVGLQRIFQNYKNIKQPLGRIPTHCCPEPTPVQNVKCMAVEELQRCDWNICHIGRTEKIYVPSVVNGVAEFAKSHPKKTIQFIFVGDSERQKTYILDIFHAIHNVRLLFLGFLYPIPQQLFKKIDVVFAISQTAVFSAEQGVPTVVASNSGKGTPGVFGVDTLDTLPDESDCLISYANVLERILVEKRYQGILNKMPKREPNDKYYEEFIQIAREATPEKLYYVDRLSAERMRSTFFLFPYAKIPVHSRIVIYGAGQVGRDYKKQLSVSRHCILVGIVDTNHNAFDDNVHSPSMLQVWQYDYIVVAVESTNMVKEIFDTILSIVPNVKERIIHDVNTIGLNRL